VEAKTYRYCEHAEYGGAVKPPAYRRDEEIVSWRARIRLRPSAHGFGTLKT